MKLFLVLSAFFIQSLAVQAATYNYKKYWSNSGLIKTDAKSQFGLELKTSPLIPSMPIAAVTYTKNNQETKERVLAVLKKTINVQNWSLESIDGLEIYEAFSKSTGTIYRLAFNPKTNDFSLASIAARYLLPTYLEAHLLQVQHLTGKKSGSNKFSLFMNLFLQDAQAVGPTITVPPISVPQLDGAITAIGNGVTSINTNITNTGTQITGAVTQASGAINNAAGAINNVAGAANNVAGAVNNMASATNNAADAINSSNQTVRDLTSSRNIARQAAVAGAVFGLTSTLSSMATNFLVNGTMTMLRTLYYEAMGEFKPEEKEERLKRFETAMNSFNELSPKLNELASKMSAASVEITLASGVSQEVYLARIDQEIETVRKSQTEAAAGCADCMSEAVLKMDQLQNLKKIVIATGNRTKDDLLKSCEKMDDLYKEWVNAEYAMLNSRRLILQDLMLFNGQMVDSIQQQDAFQEGRKKANSCKSTSEKILREIKFKVDVEKCGGAVTDMESLLCRRYAVYTDILKNCDNLANAQLNEAQKVELEEATARMSSSLTNFSKSLAAMSCEKNAATCDRAPMDKARNEVAESFKAVADQCPNRFFAQEMKKSTAIKPAVVQAPKPEEKPSLFRRIFGNGNSDARKMNQGAAQSVSDSY